MGASEKFPIFCAILKIASVFQHDFTHDDLYLYFTIEPMECADTLLVCQS